MSTPTGPPEEPIDGPVRSFLWRLRARVTTPPREDRVRDDLDRLFAAAREQAHDAPSTAADQHPDIDDAPAGRPDHPFLAGSSTTSHPARSTTAGDGDAEVVALAGRRGLSALYGVTRVAAAALVVAVVAGGIAGATTGTVSLDMLLGRDGEPIPGDDDDDQVTAAPELRGDREGATDEPAPDGSSEDAGADAGASEDRAGTDDAASPPEPDDEPEVDVDTPDAGSSEGSGTGNDTTSGGDEGTDGAEGSGDPDGSDADGDADGTGGTRDGAGSGEDAPAEDTGDVIAAPPPPASSDVDGFGGPSPCEDEDLSDCVGSNPPDGDAESGDDASDDGDTDDGADAGSASDDDDAEGGDGSDGSDEGSDGDGDGDDAEQLAKRRFNG